MALLKRLNDINHKKLFPILGVLLVLIFVLSALIMSKTTRRLEASAANLYEVTEVTSGSLASSSLLSGQVDAAQVETLTYDATKGGISEIYVYEGQYVNPGDYIFKYDQTASSIDVEKAQRSLNKAQRDLDAFIATGGQTSSLTTIVDEDGEEVNPAHKEYVSSVNYHTQLKNLQDEVANAQADLVKAQNAMSNTIYVSDISGKVIEVNSVVDESKQNPVVARIASDTLLVTGTLTEYDLASIREGQKVEITSKVYPDKKWEGRISTISDFPEETSTTAVSESGSSTTAKYKYYVKIDGDTSMLRKGFKMSMIVKDKKDSQIVPVSAVVTEGEESFVWVYNEEEQTASKQVVKLGNADASKREVKGLKEGQKIITTPNDALEESMKVEVIDALDNVTEAEGLEVSSQE